MVKPFTEKMALEVRDSTPDRNAVLSTTVGGDVDFGVERELAGD